eukprot:gene20632-24782_t
MSMDHNGEDGEGSSPQKPYSRKSNRRPKHTPEWSESHGFIDSLIKELRKDSNYCVAKKPSTNNGDEPHARAHIISQYLEYPENFGGVLFAKTSRASDYPILPCLWVKSLQMIPSSTKLSTSNKIVVLFFGDHSDHEDHIGTVGAGSVLTFEDVTHSQISKCSEKSMQQLEQLFYLTKPAIATMDEIEAFSYASQEN